MKNTKNNYAAKPGKNQDKTPNIQLPILILHNSSKLAVKARNALKTYETESLTFKIDSSPIKTEAEMLLRGAIKKNQPYKAIFSYTYSNSIGYWPQFLQSMIAQKYLPESTAIIAIGSPSQKKEHWTSIINEQQTIYHKYVSSKDINRKNPVLEEIMRSII
jgi:hypothetical protein